MSTTQLPPLQELPPNKQHRVLKGVGAVVVAGALLGIGVAIGSSGSSTETVAVPGPTVTKTVPGPTVIKTVPGPVRTVTVSPPPPAAGAVIATFNGSGTENTGKFNVPDGGNYVVSWSYSGNVDNSFGTSQPSNFAIQNTGDGMGLGLPNDIAASGHGSTVVTGASGTESFNVQAVGSWTITVKAA